MSAYRRALFHGLLLIPFLMGGLLSDPSSLRAEEPPVQPDQVDSQTASPTPSLSLTDCIRIGVSGNLGLLQRQYERDQKKLDVEAKRKIFIPTASVAVKDFFDRYKYATVEQSISTKLRDGSQAGMRSSTSDDWSDTDRRSRTHAIFLTRPLLRGFGKRVAGYELDLDKIDEEIAIEDFLSNLNRYIFETASLYFDLALERKNLEITEQACQRARRQFEDTRHDIELGALAEQEIYLVEENLVEFEIKRDTAIHQIARLEQNLRETLSLDPLAESALRVTECASLAAELATGPFAVSVPFADEMRDLLARNPDYKMKTLALKRSQTDLLYQKNQFLPKLDLTTEYRWREGREYTQRDFLSVGLAYEVPLSRRSDRALVEKSRIGERIRQLSVRDSEIALAYELRRIILRIEYLEGVLQKRSRAVELSRKKLDAESEKYKNGFSTLADLVRFQRELEASLLDELTTSVSLGKQRLNRLLVQGTLFRAFAITLDS